MDPELYLDNKLYASKMGNGYLSTAGGKIYVFVSIYIYIYFEIYFPDYFIHYM